MITRQSLAVAISGFPTARFDPYLLDRTDARWPSLGLSPTPIVWVDIRGGLHPLLPLPSGVGTTCVAIRDLPYFARILLPLVAPSQPLRSDQAIDLGDLIGLALRDGVRHRASEGHYAILKDSGDNERGMGGSNPYWQSLWWPRTPPISPQIATACIAYACGLTPEARRHIQESADTIPWRRACAVAASDPARQLELLQSRVTIRAIRDAKRASEEG